LISSVSFFVRGGGGGNLGGSDRAGLFVEAGAVDFVFASTVVVVALFL